MRRARRHSTGLAAGGRSGFSLIEVILATAILLGSVIVLSRLAGLGRTYSQDAADLAQAQRICENTLNEIVLGLRPLSPAEDEPLMPLLAESQDEESRDELQGEILRPGHSQDQLVDSNNNPRWAHSIRIQPKRGPGQLSRLTVEVRRSGKTRTAFTLTRWIRQPAVDESMTDLGGDRDLFGGLN